MKNRIAEIRKSTGLNQTEFGKRLGLGQGAVSAYEKGQRTPSNVAIEMICNEFKVNKHWLLTGEGEPFKPISRNQQIAEFIDELLLEETDESFRKRLILTLSALSIDEWEVLERIANNLVNKKED